MKTSFYAGPGPFTVETSQQNFLGDSAYHAIVAHHGGEVARVHCGDDAEAARKLANVMASAPQMVDVIKRLMDVANHPEKFGDKLQAELDALTLLENLR